MRKGVALAIAVICSSVHADPTIFGMEMGVMTENDLKSKYNVNHTGTNKYSNGNMYSIPVSNIEFKGLQKVGTIFSSEGKLVAVFTSFPKHKFDYLNQAVANKYEKVSESIPFVGDKISKYKDGNTLITLSAPHMGFSMSMNYISTEFMRVFKQKSEAESRKNQKNEAALL